MRRVAMVVAVLSLLAGCSVLTPSPGTPTAAPTTTPAPVPTDGGPGTELAPGVTTDGVVDSSRLADAHVASLEGRSYALYATRTTRAPDGTLRQRLRVNLSLAADRSYLVHTATVGPEAPVFLGSPPAEGSFWSNGSTYVRRLTRDGTTTYTTFEPTAGAGTWQYWARTVPYGGRGGNPRGFLTRTFSAVPTRVTGRVATDPQPVYRVVGTRATAPIELGITDPREVNLTATVTASGLVRSFHLSYVGTLDGSPVVVERHYRYNGVGNTSVTRPVWVDRALEE